MEFGPQNQAIISLLTTLKEIDDEYPENMLMAQRRSYRKRMTEIQAGINPNREQECGRQHKAHKWISKTK